MTVEELWEEVKVSLGKSMPPHVRLREALAELLCAPQGASRLTRGLEQKLSGSKMLLLRQLALVLNPYEETTSSKISDKERRDLLEQGSKVAQSDWKVDASYWMFLWLRLVNRDTGVARIAARDIKTLITEGGYRAEDAAARVKRLRGWGEYPLDQWIELFEEARSGDESTEFRARLQSLTELLRAGGEKPSVASAATTAKPSPGNAPRGGEATASASTAVAAKPVQGPPPRAPEAAKPVPPAVQASTVKAAEVVPPKKAEPTTPSASTTPPPAAKPVLGTPPRVGEPTGSETATTAAVNPVQVSPQRAAGDAPPVAPTAPTVAVRPVQGNPPRAPDVPTPAVATPRSEPRAGGEITTAAADTPAPVPVEERREPSQTKEPRPKRTASTKKSTAKEATSEPPQSEPGGSDVGADASEAKPAKLSGGGRAPADPPPTGGELPAVLTELASAVRAISGRLDQIASRAGDGASLEQRLVDLERRLAGVERALTETQSDAQRSRDEVERFRVRVREQEQELEDAIRERDAAATRADDLARQLASVDARVTAAESRADQNIHEAFRERDAAVLTFKARLWDAVQAQLSDVTDPTPGEEFASTEEEVLTTRLRSIRDILRAEGVPP